MTKTLYRPPVYKCQKSWAISTGDGGMIGRYWRFGANDPTNSVLRTRLFKTREEARAALHSIMSEEFVSFPQARVIRVIVEVKELREVVNE